MIVFEGKHKNSISGHVFTPEIASPRKRKITF